jgi:hypothetical protein
LYGLRRGLPSSYEQLRQRLLDKRAMLGYAARPEPTTDAETLYRYLLEMDEHNKHVVILGARLPSGKFSTESVESHNAAIHERNRARYGLPLQWPPAPGECWDAERSMQLWSR